MAIKYAITKNAFGFPSKVLAREGGKHIYNVKAVEDVANGNFVSRGDYLSLDLYKQGTLDVAGFAGIVREKAANGNYYVEVVTPGNALFVYTDPVIEEDWTKSWTNENNFYNAKDDIMRCYELAVGDIVEVSALAFKAEPTIKDEVKLTAIPGKTYTAQLEKKNA